MNSQLLKCLCSLFYFNEVGKFQPRQASALNSHHVNSKNTWLVDTNTTQLVSSESIFGKRRTLKKTA